VNADPYHLIEAALVVGLDPAPFTLAPGEAASTVAATLDQLSLEVAHQYAVGKMSFTLADEIMNNVFDFIIMSIILEDKNRDIPEISFAIYLAFDEGEYYHRNDQPGEDPEEKYTKPRVSELLRKYQNNA
jgi:hypothetical protein